MNFLEKLDFLMAREGINKRKLSEKIGMPYSTIDALYKVGYSNIKLSNLKKICEYFNVSMDYMTRDEITEIDYYDPNNPNIHFSSAETEIILHYRAADEITKELVHRALGISSAAGVENIQKEIS